MSEARPEFTVKMDLRYPEFVRLAYLVLPEGGSRKYRVALACRIAGEAMPRRAVGDVGRATAQTRTRVLARAMRLGRVSRLRLRVGLGRWPAGPIESFPEIPGGEHLRGLAPEVRAAYVLRKVEAQYRHAVHDQLVELGVKDAMAVVDAADLLAPPTSLAAPAVPMPLPNVPRGPRLRSRRPLAVAAATTVLLLGTAVFTGDNRGIAHQEALRPAAGVASWPARGDLAKDHALGVAAMRAWIRAGAGRAGSGRALGKTYGGATVGAPAENARLIYAGWLYGARVALLADANRIVRYVQSGPHASLEFFPPDRSGVAPLVLADDRYLLPPGVTRVRSATMTASQTWRPVVVRGGVALVPRTGGAEPSGCWNGPILDVQGRTVADLSGLQLATLGLTGWAPGSALPAALTCALPRPSGPVRDAAVSRFWAGKLPDGTPGAWVCARYTYLNGRSDARSVFLEGGSYHYATGNCGMVQGGQVAGMWWTPSGGSGSKRWYYVAAASAGLKVHVTGSFKATATKNGLWAGDGPSGVHPPTTKVTLTATPE